jgi:DNA-binding beta-propeller fold protein YncE
MFKSLSVSARRLRTRVVVGLSLCLLLILGLFICGYPVQPGDGKSLKFEAHIALPRSGVVSALDYMALEGGHLLVTSITSGDLYDVELAALGAGRSSSIRTLPGVGNAHGIAIVDGHVGFVTRAGSNVVDRFDRQSLRSTRKIGVADDPDAAVFDPLTRLVYVAGGDSMTATLIDADGGDIVGQVDLPGKPEFAVLDPKTGLLYQNLSNLNSVATVNLRTRKVVAVWGLPDCEGPSGMAIDADERQLFVVCSKNRKLLVFDLQTHEVVATVSVGLLSDSVAFDSGLKRLYVAGGAGQLTVVSRTTNSRYAATETIRTRIGSHTVAVDPLTHKVYLAGAGIIAAPRIAVFTPR